MNIQTPQVQSVNSTVLMLDAKVSIRKSISSWLNTIAALSIVNEILLFANVGFYFPVGLGVNYIVSNFAAVVAQSSTSGIPIPFVISLGFALFTGAVFAGLGWLFVKKNMTWAFWTAFALYIADTLLIIFLMFVFKESSMIIDLAFHGYGLFSMAFGYNKLRKL